MALLRCRLLELQPVPHKLSDLLVFLILEHSSWVVVRLEHIVLFRGFRNYLMNLGLQVDTCSSVQGVRILEIVESFNDIELLHLFQAFLWTALLTVLGRVLSLSFRH